MTPLWRKAYDAIEQPLTAGSEAWVQSDIHCPFLNAFAEQDTITPVASSEPLTRLVGSADANELRLESGHIGFVAGREATKVARPQIVDWLAAHSDED